MEESSILEEKDIAINGIKLHVADWPGEGTPILCLPGLTANCRYMDNIGERLSPQFRVIAVDFRGRGDSDKTPNGYHFAQHASDIIGLLDTLSLDKVILLGHSYGAAISSYIASQNPDRVHRVILVDGGGGGPKVDYEDLLNNIEPMITRLATKYGSAEAYFEEMKNMYEGEWSKHTEAYLKHDIGTNEDGTSSPKLTKERALQDLYSLKEFDPYHAWTNIQAPSLFLWASGNFLGKPSLSKKEPTKLIAAVIPICQWVEVKDTNHATILLGDNSATTNAIKAFLEDPSPKHSIGRMKRSTYRSLAKRTLG